jgi:hypothetical protein
MSDFVPNLPELAKLLENDSDAAQLVAAFSADSLQDARASLTEIVSNWEGASDLAARDGEASS